MAKVEWHQDELFPRVGFVVTKSGSLPRTSFTSTMAGARPNNGSRGHFALKWTRLSCRRFADNQVRLQLFALAYNLANFAPFGFAETGAHWSLTTLREKLVKMGAK